MCRLWRESRVETLSFPSGYEKRDTVFMCFPLYSFYLHNALASMPAFWRQYISQKIMIHIQKEETSSVQLKLILRFLTSLAWKCSHQRTEEGCGNRNFYPAWIFPSPQFPFSSHVQSFEWTFTGCRLIRNNCSRFKSMKKIEIGEGEMLSELLKTWLRWEAREGNSEWNLI